jgi:phosphonopyruvate decarboxylase
MIAPSRFVELLSRSGIDFFTGVPDSLLKDLCAYIDDTIPPSNHLITANEGNAVALAAGRFLGSGKLSVVYMQNSGLGNVVNPLTSLADPEVYAIPMLLVIGWRGRPGVKDEPQHVKQGRITPDLLKALEVPFWTLEASSDVEEVVSTACAEMKERHAPVAILVSSGTFAPHKKVETPSKYLLSREAAIQEILGTLGERDLVVATTGHISRELYELRIASGQGVERDFLTVGSMGHTATIALGLAQCQPERRVVCLDGDGSVLMHMGALAVIGSVAPRNLLHVVLNNGAHDSVGGQPTVGFHADFGKVASACGYRGVAYADDAAGLKDRMADLTREQGPLLLEVRVACGARKNLGRPKSSPIENRDTFMRALGSVRG